MMLPPRTEAAPSIDHMDHARVDAGLHPEAYGRADANGYRFPSGCSYAPHALAMTPAYQELVGKSCDATVSAGQAAAMVRGLSEARDYVRAVGKLPAELEAVRESTLRSLGAAIGKAVRARDEAGAVRDLARAGMRKLEAEYRAANPPPDSERYCGLGVKGFEERFGVE